MVFTRPNDGWTGLCIKLWYVQCTTSLTVLSVAASSEGTSRPTAQEEGLQGQSRVSYQAGDSQFYIQFVYMVLVEFVIKSS